MKKKYIKPEFKEVEILMNDLCVGSNCNTIDLNVIDLKKKQTKTYVFGRDDTEDFWNSKF